MNRKRKSGLQSGLGEIIARQTAPVSHKQNTSADLLEKFRDPDEPAAKPRAKNAPDTPPQSEDRLLKKGLPKTSRLLKNDILGYSNSSLLKTSSPPQNEQPINSENAASDLMSTLPDVDGYTKLWHQMTDHLYRHLTSAEQAVHVQLFRLSWGHNNPTCVIGLPGIARRTGIAKATVQRAVEGLIEKGLVIKVKTVFGRNVEQGVEYEVVPPPALLKTSSLLKTSRLLKMSTIKEVELKETHTNTAAEKTPPQKTEPVCVCSRYPIEDCRRFARHLQQTGQGIKNPGGYATKIHRTGEADELIAEFLMPPPAEHAPKLDIAECPDCHGTGFYEPGGAGKGVARCKHQRLTRG